MAEKQWFDMTWEERADECERIAGTYGEGWCKDRVMEQAEALRRRAGIEKEKNKNKQKNS